MKQLLGLLLLLPFLGQAQGIQFEESLSWEQVKAKAKAENKYIFADCFTTWCGPCKKMEKVVYPNDTVGNAFNSQFISIKVQMDSSQKDNDHIKSWYAAAGSIMQQYKVNAFPTYLFFSPDGKLVHKDLGYKPVPAFAALAGDAVNPDKQYYTLLEKSKEGKLDAAATMRLVHTANSFNEANMASSVAAAYIKGLDTKALFEKENLQMIKTATTSTKDAGFSVLYKNREKVNNILGQDEAEATIFNAIHSDAIKPLIKKDGPKPDWTAIRKNLTAKYGKLGEELAMQSQTFYAVNSKDWGMFGKVAKSWFEQYGSKRKWVNNMTLNTIAWAAFENTDDKQGLEAALTMSNKIIESGEGSAAEIDTYANLLYKLGQKEKALEWEAKAVEGAPDQKDIQEAYEKMKKGEPTWPVK